MKKQLDLSKRIFKICSEDPGVIDIMKSIGFNRIADPKLIRTVGRIMTIPMGAEMMNISLDSIKEEFIRRGYEIVGGSNN